MNFLNLTQKYLILIDSISSGNSRERGVWGGGGPPFPVKKFEAKNNLENVFMMVKSQNIFVCNAY